MILRYVRVLNNLVRKKAVNIASVHYLATEMDNRMAISYLVPKNGYYNGTNVTIYFHCVERDKRFYRDVLV